MPAPKKPIVKKPAVKKTPATAKAPAKKPAVAKATTTKKPAEKPMARKTAVAKVPAVKKQAVSKVPAVKKTEAVKMSSTKVPSAVKVPAVKKTAASGLTPLARLMSACRNPATKSTDKVYIELLIESNIRLPTGGAPSDKKGWQRAFFYDEWVDSCASNGSSERVVPIWSGMIAWLTLRGAAPESMLEEVFQSAVEETAQSCELDEDWAAEETPLEFDAFVEFFNHAPSQTFMYRENFWMGVLGAILDFYSDPKTEACLFTSKVLNDLRSEFKRLKAQAQANNGVWPKDGSAIATGPE